MLSISVFISLSDSSLFSMLEILVAAIKELRVELESELELDLVSFEVLIVSEFKLELIKILLVSQGVIACNWGWMYSL
jgi:hypothetical protein